MFEHSTVHELGLFFSFLHCMTRYPRAWRQLSSMQNKCTHLERDMDVVIGLWNQLVKYKEGGEAKESACVIEDVAAVCLLTMPDAAGRSWLFHIYSTDQNALHQTLRTDCWMLVQFTLHLLTLRNGKCCESPSPDPLEIILLHGKARSPSELLRVIIRLSGLK